jgi:hypothetical protein
MESYVSYSVAPIDFHALDIYRLDAKRINGVFFAHYCTATAGNAATVVTRWRRDRLGMA